MIPNKDDKDNDENLNIQRDILSGRKFSLAEAIGKEGGSFLKGESPVPQLVQALTQINMFIDQNLLDLSGALQAVLYNWVKADSRVSQYLSSPLTALSEILSNLLENQNLFYEFVRQVDYKWGQMYQERPYFQQPGQPPHPDDEYTHESVRLTLMELLNAVNSLIRL